MTVEVANTPGASGWISLALTAALLIITGVYAKYTRDMVNEMRKQRQEDRERRRQEKSDRAAYECLHAVRDLSEEMNARSPSAIDLGEIAAVRGVLNGEGPLVDDEVVRDRMTACAEVLLVASYPTEKLAQESLDVRAVMLGAREIVWATRRVLESHLAERGARGDLWARPDDGHGGRLPDSGAAAAWIRRVGHS